MAAEIETHVTDGVDGMKKTGSQMRPGLVQHVRASLSKNATLLRMSGPKKNGDGVCPVAVLFNCTRS